MSLLPPPLPQLDAGQPSEEGPEMAPEAVLEAEEQLWSVLEGVLAPLVPPPVLEALRRFWDSPASAGERELLVSLPAVGKLVHAVDVGMAWWRSRGADVVEGSAKPTEGA